MKVINVTPGLLPIPPNGWGAVEKIIWETHCNLLKLGYDSEIKYLDDVSNNGDVIHIHVANLANIAYERGIPYYFTMHDHHAYLYGKESQVYKENLQAIKNAKKAFVPAKFLIEYFENIPQYFSHGVDIIEFQPGNSKEHKLLCVANNGFIHNQSEDRKGFGYAIKAAEQLDLPITIVGPSNNKNYFECFPSDYKKLTVLYDVNEEELKKIYKEHTIFLHPSILEAGHPNLTLLEALSSGLPVVGTYENNNELKGIIKIERNVEQIVEAIKKLLIPENYLLFSSEARTQAVNLSWNNRTKELLKYYNMDLVNSYLTTKQLNKPSVPLIPSFTINFIDGAFFEIRNAPGEYYKVSFIDKKTNQVIHSGEIGNDCWIKANRKYFTDWKIQANNGETIFEYDINLEDQRVYIALDSKSLGDTLAWFPYVEEFRKKHKCQLICSTFWNDFFKTQYPEIIFVNPGETVHNILAMYTIGWYYFEDGRIDFDKNPNDFKLQPLQKTASDILGLEYKEIVPKIKLNKNIERENIISIAIHSTAQAKYWNNQEGWQQLVDYLKEKGYKVVLISQEEDRYMGNKHPEGIEQLPKGPIEKVIETLQKSKMFIGIGSGLSWLSWATNTPTTIISGFSYDYTETQINTIRITAPQGKCNGCFNTHRLNAGDWNWCPVWKGTPRQFECSKSITTEQVISAIEHLI